MTTLVTQLLFLLCNLLTLAPVSLGQIQEQDYHPLFTSSSFPSVATSTITQPKSAQLQSKEKEISSPSWDPKKVQSPELLIEIARIRSHFQSLTSEEKFIALETITSKLKLAPNFVAQLLYKTPIPVPVPSASTSPPPIASESADNLYSLHQLNATTTNNNTTDTEAEADPDTEQITISDSGTVISPAVSIPGSNTSKVLQTPTPTAYTNTNTNISSSSEPSIDINNSTLLNSTSNLTSTLLEKSENKTASNPSHNVTEKKIGKNTNQSNKTVTVVLRAPPPFNHDHKTGPNVSDTNIENGFGALVLTDYDDNSNGTFNGTQEELLPQQQRQQQTQEDQDRSSDGYWKDKIGKLLTDIGERCNILYC